MATATLEADDDIAEFAAMTPEARQTYVDGLHDNLQSEKAEQTAREEAKFEPPEPGKTAEETAGQSRDESGRFAKPPETETTETPVNDDETPVVDDAAPVANTGKGEEVQDWRDAEVKDLATQYGIDETKLAKIPSREVLDVLLESIDKKAFDAGKTDTKPTEVVAKPEDKPAATKEQTEDALTLLESLKLGDADGNLALEDREPIEKTFKALAAEVKEGRAFRKEVQTFLENQKKQEAHASFTKLKSDFGNSVDSLGHTELFGKPGERTKEQAANFEKVFNDGHLPHARGLIAQGRQVGPTPAFAKAAVNLLFGDQLVKQAKQQQIDKLKKSSARRTGGGVTKPHPLAKDATPLQQNLSEANENWRKSHGEES